MRCICKGYGNPPWEGPHSWQFKPLLRLVDVEIVIQDFGAETVERWMEGGIEDFEADRVATHYHLWPPTVWPGYLEAGLDFYEVDDNE